MLKGFKSKVFGAPSSETPERPASSETPQADAKQFRRLEDRSGPDDAVVSAQSSFKGEISGRAGARIAGEMQGDIRCEGLVWVEETAKVKGNIFCAYVILEGELEGNIGPALHVELRTKARMRGNIQTKLLAIADGSYFEGQVNMPTPEAQPVRFAEKRQPKPGRD
jgi:cytoskeletal protein CcmA (bactofilin family)